MHACGRAVGCTERVLTEVTTARVATCIPASLCKHACMYSTLSTLSAYALHVGIRPCAHVQAAAHRWYVLGLREAGKALRLGRAKLLLLAPNMEEGLEEVVQALVDRWGAMHDEVKGFITSHRQHNRCACVVFAFIQIHG